MKKVLLGSTALVAAGMIASAPASAKIKLGVGGYMEQWVATLAKTTLVIQITAVST